MSLATLGRTNQVYPPVWYRLLPPGSGVDPASLAEAAQAVRTVLDVSAQPGLYGGLLRGQEYLAMAVGDGGYAGATDHEHALDLTQAHLIQTLSAIGRERMEFYFLPVRRVVEEYQIAGALEALELAVQDGHIAHLGLASDGPALATLGLWQFHDAFEAILTDAPSLDTLAPLARERRVGIVVRETDGGDASLRSVRTLAEVG